MEEAQDIQSLRIARVVNDTRRALFRGTLWAAVCWCLAVAALWVVASASLDLIWPLPVAGRIAALAIGVVLMLAAVVFCGITAVLDHPDEQHTAFLIERTLPGMHNRLVTALDIHHGRAAASTGPRDRAFVRRLMEQTEDRLRDFNIRHVADGRMFRNAGITLVVILCVAAVGTALLRERAVTAFSRLVRPTAPIPPASWVHYAVFPGDTEVLQGDPVVIRARFDRGGPVPLTLNLRSDSGVWQRYPMPPDEQGIPSFTLSSLGASCEYQIEGGNTWSAVHRVTMLRRPIVERIEAGVLWPEYLGFPDVRPVERLDSAISVPQGSTIRLTVGVSGEPVSGQIQLYQAITTTRDIERERESVWFDDDTPADAELSGTWNWTADRVLSGARAMAPHWSRKPFGFTTRLYRTRLRPESAFFIYVYIEPEQTPHAISIKLTIQDQPVTAVWRAPNATAAPASPAVIEMGELPAAGDWRRLDAPVVKLLASRPGADVVLSGIEVNAASGRVLFDRAGVVDRRAESVTEQHVKECGTVTMQLQDKAWIGLVPVEQDGLMTVEFRNHRGDPSPAMKPIPFAATVDQSPSVLVEKPATNITLTTPEPIPLMARAFDDFGIAEIGIEYGEDPAKPTQSRTICRYEQPEPSQLLFSSIDPDVLGVRPGQATYYRVSVRDRKGQSARSESYRLAVAAPDAPPATDIAVPAPPLNPLLEGLSQLVGAQTQLVAAAVDAVAGLPDTARKPAVQVRHDRLVNDDRTPMSQEQIKTFHDQRLAAIKEEQRQALEKLDDELAAQRERALKFAKQIEEAADQAARSPTAIPAEIAAMRSLAEHVREIAEMDEDQAFEEAVALGRSMEIRDLTVEQRAKLQDLQRQLSEMVDARNAFKSKPDESQMQMAALLAGLEASRALDKIDQFDAALGMRGEQLRSLQEELAQLQARSSKAPASELDEMSQDQNAFDAEAIRLMEEARNLLSDQMAGRAQERDEMPPEPWAAPGRTHPEAPSVETDTPDPKKPHGSTDKVALPQGDNWWDKPSEEPGIRSNVETDPQWRDRDKRPVEPDPSVAGGKPTRPDRSNNDQNQEPQTSPTTPEGEGSQENGSPSPRTPREALAAHQREMASQLASRARQLDAAREQARRLSSDIAGQMKAMRSSSPEQAGQMAASLVRMLSSEAARRATSAGERAAASQRQASRGLSPRGDQRPSPPATGISTGGAPGSQPSPGMILDTSPMPVGTGATAIYRLPPRLREPLIQGMRERGPEAYQSFIDAYYRSLSKDAK